MEMKEDKTPDGRRRFVTAYENVWVSTVEFGDIWGNAYAPYNWESMVFYKGGGMRDIMCERTVTLEDALVMHKRLANVLPKVQELIPSASYFYLKDLEMS